MKLYRIDADFLTLADPKLEAVSLIREEIALGASEPTLIVRYSSGRVAQCSRDFFHLSPYLAWADYADGLKREIEYTKQIILDQTARIDRCEKLLEQVTSQTA